MQAWGKSSFPHWSTLLRKKTCLKNSQLFPQKKKKKKPWLSFRSLPAVFGYYWNMGWYKCSSFVLRKDIPGLQRYDQTFLV